MTRLGMRTQRLSLRKLKSKCKTPDIQNLYISEYETEQKETQEYLFKRSVDENRQKEEQIDEMLAVVYHYSDVLEKWENIKFISQKEKKEMENKL